MKNEKIYCRLCNTDMTNDKSETQFHCTLDDVSIHYCKECGKYGYEIMKRYIKSKDESQRNDLSFDPHNEIKKIESRFKKTNGNFSISFHNNFNYDESIIQAPILINGKPIGVITSVTPKEVEGFIWESVMSINTHYNSENKPIAFEIIN